MRIASDERVKFFGDKLGGVRAAAAIVQLTKRSAESGGPLKLELGNARRIGAPAVVSYRPLKLEFDRAVWTKALLSDDPDANYIAGHELGHIVLHNHDAQPYSGVKKGWIDFEQHSAEWQANKFADYFLVTDQELLRFISPDVIAKFCKVPLAVAERRFLEVARMAQCCCQQCFGTRVYRIRLDHFCWTCRQSFM
jgi:IrrE N-terminal-like domain